MAQFVQHADQQPADIALRNARLGLVLWRIANGMVFVFFVYANYLMRTVQPSWPPPGVARLDTTVPILISVVIILSSVVASQIRAAMRSEKRANVQRGIALTSALGLLFFAGLLVVCTQVPYSGPYSSIVLAMNAFHGVHVVVGVALFLNAALKVQRGVYTKDRHWGLEGAVVFWHFVSAMWVFFFLVIYVL